MDMLASVWILSERRKLSWAFQECWAHLPHAFWNREGTQACDVSYQHGFQSLKPDLRPLAESTRIDAPSQALQSSYYGLLCHIIHLFTFTFTDCSSSPSRPSSSLLSVNEEDLRSYEELQSYRPYEECCLTRSELFLRPICDIFYPALRLCTTIFIATGKVLSSDMYRRNGGSRWQDDDETDRGL